MRYLLALLLLCNTASAFNCPAFRGYVQQEQADGSFVVLDNEVMYDWGFGSYIDDGGNTVTIPNETWIKFYDLLDQNQTPEMVTAWDGAIIDFSYVDAPPDCSFNFSYMYDPVFSNAFESEGPDQ